MGRKRKTDEQFRREVFELVGDEYEFLEVYQTNNSKIAVKHVKCGYVYEVTPNAFLRGDRCRKCSYGRRTKTNEEFQQEVYELVGDEYTFMETYKGAAVKIAVKHVECGHIYEIAPNVFLPGSRCPKCSHIKIAAKLTKTNDQFLQEVAETENGHEYEFFETYKGAAVKIAVKHVECGHVYKVRPNDFLCGKRCPNCFYSRGEHAVKTALDSLGIEYIREYSFRQLGRQRYDFFIPSLYACIEYDGQQHFEAVEHWGGEEKLKRTQESDRIKNEFADSINLRLLRIPYTELEDVGVLVRRWIAEIKTQEYTDSTPIKTVEAV